MLLSCGTLGGGGVWEGTMPLTELSAGFQALPPLPTAVGPFWCWFSGGWFCVSSRTLWVSPMNPPVRLGVSPVATTPTGLISLRFWVFISPSWNRGLCYLCCSPVTPSGWSSHKCGTAWSTNHLLTHSTSHHLAASPLHPNCQSLPLLPVWMNAASLIPWLSDFHTVQFSGSSGCFLFLNSLSFFWLCEEAQCIYLHLHLGWKSFLFSKSQIY